jgi:hypothetical protein
MADEEEPNILARFNTLAGQVHALRCVVAAAVTLLRDDPRFAQEFEAATQIGLTNLEKTRASIHAFDGFQEIVGPLQKKIGGRA